MKISKLSLSTDLCSIVGVFAFSLSCSSQASADLSWDFSDGDTHGWEHYSWKETYVGMTEPGKTRPIDLVFSPFGFGQPTWDTLYYTYNTTEKAAGQWSGAVNDSGSLVSYGMVKAPISGDLSEYIGGSMAFHYSDYSSGPVSAGESGALPRVYTGYVYLTGQIGGVDVVLRQQLDYNFDNDGVQDFTLQLDHGNSGLEYFMTYQSYDEGSMSYGYHTVIFDPLSEAEFLEFMSNLSGVYFRMMTQYSSYNDSSIPEPISRLYSVDLQSLALVPEPATATLGLLGFAGLMIRRRR